MRSCASARLSAVRDSSIAPAIPGSMLLPARLHTTVVPGSAASASAMRFVVVVLPFVPVTTTLLLTSGASELKRSGCILSAMRPGSTPPWRLKTERSPQRARSLEVHAMRERISMGLPYLKMGDMLPGPSLARIRGAARTRRPRRRRRRRSRPKGRTPGCRR